MLRSLYVFCLYLLKLVGLNANLINEVGFLSASPLSNFRKIRSCYVIVFFFLFLFPADSLPSSTFSGAGTEIGLGVGGTRLGLFLAGGAGATAAKAIKFR
jgi:hypothetical protein